MARTGLQSLHIPYTSVGYEIFPRAADGRVRGEATHRRILTGCSAHLWRVQPAAGSAPAASERGGAYIYMVSAYNLRTVVFNGYGCFYGYNYGCLETYHPRV